MAWDSTRGRDATEYRKALMQKQQEQQMWEMQRGLRRDSSMEASLQLRLP